MKTTQEQALARIQGTITTDGENVMYYDDSMCQHYLAPVEDLRYLQDLMDSDDEEVQKNVYSHWCAGTGHPECDEQGRTESRQKEDGTLIKGDKYDPATLACVGWTRGDGSGHEGYDWRDYLKGDSDEGPWEYLGRDEHGIEPIFENLD